MNTIATTFNPSPALSGASEPNHGLATAVWTLLRRLSGHSPATLQARDPVREAAAVRQMADSIRASDSRFAADLYAAADRHEQLYAGLSGSNENCAAPRVGRIER
jgi:hypothetical protein